MKTSSLRRFILPPSHLHLRAVQVSFILRMNRSFSLRSGADFQRVWNDGKSWSHPLIILRARANGMAQCRFGFVAGKKVGKATRRNRSKRLMREAIQHRLSAITPGWDIVLIARSGAEQAELKDVAAAIETLLQRAQLVVIEK